MARRESKRIDLIPDFMGPDSDPSDDPSLAGLKLEIAMRKGALREFPFTTEVRGDLAGLLNVNISHATWRKIKVATARYVFRVSQFCGGLSSVTVRTVCKDLVMAIDKFQQAYDRNARDPRIAAFLHEICVDMGVGDLTIYRGF
jgi:hypothetical protein